MIRDSKILLLDVGGTFIKCSDGREIPVNSAGTREEIASSLREAVGDATELAVAIPGPFNYAEGVFLMKHKFQSVYGEKFTAICGIEEDSAVFEHDVVAMLKGELASGTASGRVALVTIGTGLGFVMSLDGDIPRNGNGSPLVPIYNLPYRDGILEDYASKRGMYRLYGSDAFTVKEIASRAIGGEEKALDAFAAMGAVIGSQIVPVLEKYGIETLLFGGQISRNFLLFGPSLEKELSKAGLRVDVKPVSDFDNATFNGLKYLLTN